MLSINNDLHWIPEEKNEAISAGKLVDSDRRNRFGKIFDSKKVLTGVDWTIALTVLSPLCILYWRGTWQLLDIYVVIPDTYIKYPSGYISLAIGYLLTFLSNATQRPVSNIICNKRNHVIVRVFVSRIYTLIFAFGLVNLWRGVWQLLDEYFTNSWYSGAGSAVVGCWALASLRTLRNISAPPVIINTDVMDSDYTASPTMFQTLSTKKSTWFFLLDVGFSVIIVGSLVVFVWRGLWVVEDRLLYPDSNALSCWMSLAIGYTIVFMAYLLQKPSATLSKKLSSNLIRVLFEDLFYLFASFGAITMWRGVWLFADVYIWPDDREISNWITSLFGMIGLIVLGAGNTMLAKGVVIDGGIKDGTGCIFNTEYLRKFFKEDQLEMIRKMDVAGGGKSTPADKMTPVESSQTSKLINELNHQTNTQNNVTEVIIERETVM
ncbi:hypothetical protein CHUAL_001770 [Chamberlinius hualienensis]